MQMLSIRTNLDMGVFKTVVGVSFFILALQLPSMTSAQLLEEITVTARKIEESVMDVPVSITVVGGDVVQEGNIGKLEDLSALLPNFHHAETISANDQLFIRGVGSGVNFGFENSVGQVIDGIFLGRARFGRSLFMDLERIEVLKGPQGALIGKNTTAGALNISSANPTDEFEAYIIPTWEFDGDEGATVEGAISGPFNDAARGRLAIRYENKDGISRNTALDRDELQREEIALRSKLAFDISEGLNAAVMYQYSKSEREGRTQEIFACSAAYAAFAAQFGEDCQFNLTRTRSLVINGQPAESSTDTESHLVALTVNWDTGLGQMTSRTAYAKYKLADLFDSDPFPIERTTLDTSEDYEQWSQEFQLASTGETLDYLVGAFFQTTDQRTRFGVNFNALGPAPFLPFFPPFARTGTRIFSDQDSDTQAVFGEVTWHMNSQWDLIAGFRYTHEDKSIDQVQFPTQLYTDTPVTVVIPPGFPPALANLPSLRSHDISRERTENQFTPNGAIRFRPNEDMMFFAKISKGFKGGGFDQQLNQNQVAAEAGIEFDDEQVIAYEVGGKFEFPEAGVRISLTAFRNEFDDLQVSSLIVDDSSVINFRVGNAASAITQGLELEAQWRPTENLNFNLSAAYLDAEFDEYDEAPCNQQQLNGLAPGCVTIPPAGPGAPPTRFQNLDGQDLQYSPEFAYSLDGSYNWLLSDSLRLNLFARVYYSDDQFLALDLDPNTIQDASTKLDASLSLSDVAGRWRISLIGRNLTDELTSNFANDAGTQSFFKFPLAPRSLAMQASLNF